MMTETELVISIECLSGRGSAKDYLLRTVERECSTAIDFQSKRSVLNFLTRVYSMDGRTRSFPFQSGEKQEDEDGIDRETTSVCCPSLVLVNLGEHAPVPVHIGLEVGKYLFLHLETNQLID